MTTKTRKKRSAALGASAAKHQDNAKHAFKRATSFATSATEARSCEEAIKYATAAAKQLGIGDAHMNSGRFNALLALREEAADSADIAMTAAVKKCKR